MITWRALPYSADPPLSPCGGDGDKGEDECGARDYAPSGTGGNGGVRKWCREHSLTIQTTSCRRSLATPPVIEHHVCGLFCFFT